MEVFATQPFELVYSIIENRYLGYIIEPHVVQVNSKGSLTLSHQRLFSNTTDPFHAKMDDSDIHIIQVLDLLTEESVFKKFYIPSSTRKKIKPADYFQKLIPEGLFEGTIRPYIERKLNEVIALLQSKHIYLSGTNGNPAALKVSLQPEVASILFHFRRNELHTRYFATIKHQGIKVDFIDKPCVLLTISPCWFVVEDQLYCFEDFVDGKKLKPFLTRKFIEIPKKTEEKYFQEFVRPLLERFDVYAEGFSIVTEQSQAKPVLSLQRWGKDMVLHLFFDYAGHVFHYHQGKRVHVWIEKKKEQYTFHRVRRSRNWENERVKELQEQGLVLKEGSLFHLENEEKVSLVQWLIQNVSWLKSRGFVIEQKLQHSYFLGEQKFHFEVNEFKDWFDVYAVAQFGEFEFPFIKLKNNIIKGIREFVLPNGDIAVIPEEWFTTFGGLFEYAQEEGEKLRLKRLHVGLLDVLWANEENRRKTWTGKLKIFTEVASPEPVDMPLGFKAQLRPYQKEGLDWFWFLKQHDFGGILADDMGLGKTVQILCLFQKIKEDQMVEASKKPSQFKAMPLTIPDKSSQLNLFEISTSFIEDYSFAQPSSSEKSDTTIRSSSQRPHLVVAPTSLIFNWLNEARRFSPGLHILVHVGQQRTKSIQHFLQYDVIITTYGTLRSDDELFKEQQFDYVVLDESQSIKNAHSQTARSVMKLRADHKLVLTGTPIENSIVDLWSQMNFVNPGLLGSYQSFIDNFVNPVEKNHDVAQIARLQALVKPFILRRTKKMVASDLPEKQEQVRMCEMHEEQASLYESVKSYFRNQIIQAVADKTFSKNRMSIFQGINKLRQIANHPLMTESDYLGGSGKFDEVTRLAKTVMEEGHKIIMFSQFVKHLDLYRKYFDETGVNYAYLDGSTPATERKKIVDEFQKSTQIRIFLISLKAGGFGLNLTAADYVFLLDPWWNPAVEKQAQDRSHRIGQDKKVIIYKFITKDTIEGKILMLQDKKKELAENIIISDDQAIKKVSADDLLELVG